MESGHISVVSVPVRDQDRAKEFYVDTLGFRAVSDQPVGPDMRWVQVAPPGGEASVALVTWFETMPPGSCRGLVLSVPDAEAAYTELSSKGVTFAAELQDAPWGRFTTFDDPDGNGWVLQQDRG